MANYLDLDGTTDVVGRIKAKLNDKASNDDVQVIVDELALKADIEKIGKINGQAIYDNGDITISDGHFKYNSNSVDDSNGIVVNPSEIPIWTKTTLAENSQLYMEQGVKYYMNFNANGNYELKDYSDALCYTTFTITDGVIGNFVSGKNDFLFNWGIFYDKDGNVITDKTKSYNLNEVYLMKSNMDWDYTVVDQETVFATVSYADGEKGAFSVVDGEFSKLATNDYVDEKIGDINNVLTNIIG